MRWPGTGPKHEAPLTPAEVVARRRKWRRLRLSWLGIAALAWVSYGSYELVVWAMNISTPLGQWGALAYPLIVDLGVILVMPYSTDASLPARKELNVRQHASVTVNVTFVAILTFNAAHALIVANDAAQTWSGWKPWAAIIAGSVPVFLYIRAGKLITMVESWEANERARMTEEAAAAAVAADTEARRRAEEQRAEAERLAAERAAAAEREERAARARREELAAQVELERARAETARATPAAPRAAASTGGRPGKGLTVEQERLLAELPGSTKREKTIAFLQREHAEGRPVNGTEAAARLGTDPSETRKVYNALKAEGRLRPELMVAGERR